MNARFKKITPKELKDFYQKNRILFYLIGLLFILYIIFFIFDPFNLNKIYFSVVHTDYLYGEVHPQLLLTGHHKNQHVGGSALISSAIKKIKEDIKKNEGHFLLLDAGSSLFGGNTTHDQVDGGKLIVEIMNGMGYDALTMGNAELDYGLPILKKIIPYAKFPLLGANIISTRTQQIPSYIRPYIIKNLPQLKVGVLGLSNPSMDQIGPVERLGDLEFRPFIEYAKKYVEELKRHNVDMIIILSDLWNLDDEIALAKYFHDDIQLIVASAKYEENFDAPIWVGEVPIVKTPRKLKSVGRFDFIIDSHSKKIVQKKWQAYPILSSLYTPDNHVIESISTLSSDSAQLVMKRVLGHSLMEMPYETIQEGAFGNLMTDILREKTQAEIAFINSPDLKGFTEGEITYESIIKGIPYDNKILTMSLSGIDIKEILENSFQQRLFVGILQESGIRFSYDLSRTYGQRVFDITVNGVSLVPEDTYKVATIEFLKNGGDGHKTFSKGGQLEYYPDTLRGILSEYIQEKVKIFGKLDGRMNNLTPPGTK